MYNRIPLLNCLKSYLIKTNCAKITRTKTLKLEMKHKLRQHLITEKYRWHIRTITNSFNSTNTCIIRTSGKFKSRDRKAQWKNTSIIRAQVSHLCKREEAYKLSVLDYQIQSNQSCHSHVRDCKERSLSYLSLRVGVFHSIQSSNQEYWAIN